MPQLLDVLVCSEAEETELCPSVARAAMNKHALCIQKKPNILAEWGENDNILTSEFVFIEHAETFRPDAERVSIYYLCSINITLTHSEFCV